MVLKFNTTSLKCFLVGSVELVLISPVLEANKIVLTQYQIILVAIILGFLTFFIYINTFPFVKLLKLSSSYTKLVIENRKIADKKFPWFNLKDNSEEQDIEFKKWEEYLDKLNETIHDNVRIKYHFNEEKFSLFLGSLVIKDYFKRNNIAKILFRE